jgi:DNA replication protein DnaC
VNVIELQRALRQLRLGGVAAVLETRLHQAQAEPMAPIDLISCLVSDELTRRSERLLERRRKQAAFRDPYKTLDNFDFTFNSKMNRSLVFDLATCGFIGKREDALFLGPGGTGKSHLAQAIGQAVKGGVKGDHRGGAKGNHSRVNTQAWGRPTGGEIHLLRSTFWFTFIEGFFWV